MSQPLSPPLQLPMPMLIVAIIHPCIHLLLAPTKPSSMPCIHIKSDSRNVTLQSFITLSLRMSTLGGSPWLPNLTDTNMMRLHYLCSLFLWLPLHLHHHPLSQILSIITLSLLPTQATSEALQVVIWDIMSHFCPFLYQLIGHYSSLWGIMPEYHVECPISSFLYVKGT